MFRFVFWFACTIALTTLGILSFPVLIPFCVQHSPTILFIGIVGIYLVRYFNHKFLICIIAGLTIGCLYPSIFHTLFVQPVQSLNGKTLLAQAEIVNFPDIYQNNQRVEVKINRDSVGVPYPIKQFCAIGYLPKTETPLKPGDRVEVLVQFYIPTSRQGFDRQTYHRSNGNYISFSYLKDRETKEPAQFSVTPADQIPLLARPQIFAHQLSFKILGQLPERQAGFLCSLLLGNRTYLDSIDQQNLQKVGLSHIIAVSGLHLMFLIGFLQRVLSRKIGILFSFFAIFFFILMVGSSPSILRAGIMAALSGIAFLFGRETDSQTSLGIALIILLAINPYSIFSLSLQLSFLSTLGIIRFASRLDNTFHQFYTPKLPVFSKCFSVISAAVSCALCATLFTAPVLLSSFGYITLLSLPSNVLTLSLISIIFLLGLLLCMIPFVIPFLATLLTFLIDCVLFCAQALGNWHWGVLYWNELSGKIAIVSCLFLILCLLTIQKCYPKITIPTCFLLLVGSICYAHQVHSNTTRVTLHSVGDGQMISIANGYTHFSLIDCGSSANQDGLQTLKETMNWYGFSQIDHIILTAVDKSHARNIAQIVTELPVRDIIIPQNLRQSDTLEALQQSASLAQVPILPYHSDLSFYLSGIENTEIFSQIDRKLAIHLQDTNFNLLIVHSMTQNMLQTFLDEQSLQAHSVIMANQFEKPYLLQQALAQIQPKELILSSGFSSMQTLFDVPVRSTAQVGDITWTIPHR